MTNTLQKYLLNELLRTFIPALLCFEFLMLLGFSIQLLHKGLDVPSLAYVIPFLAIYALPHALPSSLLTATVMTYGRLSADNEITAIRSAGIHLHKIITPIVIAGIFFSLLTLYLNAEVLPKSYFKVRKFQEKAVKQVLAKHFITANKKIDFHPYQIYISNVEDGIYKNIAVFEFAEDYIVSILLAEEGEIAINDAGNLALLTLRRGEFIKPSTKNSTDIPKMGSFEEATFDIPLRQKVRNTALKYATLTNLIVRRGEVDNELKISKTLFEDPEKTIKITMREIPSINEKKKEVEKKLGDARIRDKKRKILIAERSIGEESKKIEKATVIIEENGPLKKQLEKEHLTLSKRIEGARKQKLKRELSLNIHKRLSPPFSCLTFILIGIPLGIMTRSSSMLVSLGISFILILFFYYPLVATGLILAENITFPIIPSLWGANAFIIIVGLVLFRNIFNK
jgi:lipopolysaccharide export LptBFGC system permease protein LptF